MPNIIVASGIADTAISAASTTLYALLGDSRIESLQATEADNRITCRNPGTLSGLRVSVSVNGRSTATTYTVMKNGSAQSLAVSVAGGATGITSDTSNTVSLANGDTYSLRRSTGTGTGNLLNDWADCKLAVTTGSAKQIVSQGTGGTSAASSTVYAWPVGLNMASATEADAYVIAPVNCTLSKMSLQITANGRGTTTTYASRNNAGAGNQSISVTAGATGFFEDASNTDSVTAGNPFNMSRTTGTGAGTITTGNYSFMVTTDGLGFPFVSTGPFTNATNPYYIGIFGQGNESTTSTDLRYDFPFNTTASKLSLSVTANTSATDTLVKSRKNGSDGNQVVTITALTTGTFRDTTNADSFATGDDVNYSVSGHTVGAPTIRAISMFLTETITAGVKTWDGLTYSSVKTVNGLAVASVKTIDGLAAQ